MRPRIKAGEVWLVDLGMVAKIRPVLALTDEPADLELALVTIVAHTTQRHEGNPWELNIPKPFLKPGAFHLQQVNSVSLAKFERRMGALSDSELALVKAKLAERLRMS